MTSSTYFSLILLEKSSTNIIRFILTSLYLIHFSLNPNTHIVKELNSKHNNRILPKYIPSGEYRVNFTRGGTRKVGDDVTCQGRLVEVRRRATLTEKSDGQGPKSLRHRPTPQGPLGGP